MTDSPNGSAAGSFWRGTLAVMPLTIAVIPWGILAGSLALESGLSPIQSQAMSAIIFAGSAQLVALGMLKAASGLMAILVTTALITSRHLLYAMAMREAISPLPLRWRLILGFLLTDELFAIANQGKLAKFDPWYALGGGLSFYLGWNLATLAGILAGNAVDNLGSLGLDFAIAATFIALVVPRVKDGASLLCVLTALCLSVLCEALAVPGGLLIASLSAMAVGYGYSQWGGRKS
ncbi:AzlC family ABC transporter permease [Shewanella sedimentimangrovi]|uniref:AzlC family ABC transporter permease n=1 Tax=Shewanella sedimentimangrovi TaxID=2814293 RepID=A0ABX7R3T7_9GAMM|nr:AzlC family ABC transporter permease [Shewanella sedimentimangrovi]QSX38448.1 AzlC family ABC transporter permease [Shewanella sedimentimangrovi]